jgi:hypothetical protein
MPYTTIDVTDEVVAIKRLDVAAVIPKMLAFAFAGVALITLVLDIRDWVLWFSMICTAIFLALIGRAIEHGSAWAVVLMTVAVSALSLFSLVGIVIYTGDLITGRLEDPSESNLKATAGLILLLIGTAKELLCGSNLKDTAYGRSFRGTVVCVWHCIHSQHPC